MALLWKSCPMLLSINEIEIRRSLSRAQLTVAGDQVLRWGQLCRGLTSTMKYMFVKDLSNFRAQVSNHSTGVELLEPTPGLLDNPYLDDLHCICMPRLSRGILTD